MTDNGTLITTLGRLGSALYQAVKGRLWVGSTPTSAVDLWGSITVTTRSHPVSVTERNRDVTIITRTKELTVQ
jgi:hypothetical protein